MANPLTGEFDIAAQLSVAALNRVLAAQHQMSEEDQMYFHSVRIRVPAGADHGVAGVIDIQVSTPSISLPQSGPPVAVGAATAASVTAVALLHEFNVATLVHPGVIAPPWLPSPGGDSRVTVHFQVMARFRPSADSITAPEFVHGEVMATVDAEQITSTSGNVLTVDFGADDVSVSFLPAGGAQLSAAEVEMLNRVVRHLVRTSFEPVNHVIALPSQAGGFAPHHWRFKTMPGDASPGVAILFNMRQDRVPTDADRDAFDGNALGAGDDFVVAAGSQFLIPALRDLLRDEIQDQVVGATTRYKLSVKPLFGFGPKVTVADVKYEITSDSEPVVELQPNAVSLTASVTARGTGFPSPDVKVTITQAFTLVAINGRVKLQRIGDVGVDLNFLGTIADFILTPLKGRIETMIREKANDALDSAVLAAAPVLDDMLSGLDSLGADIRIPAPQLSYQAIDITSDGIIVRGDLAIVNWSPVAVSFTTRTIPGSRLELDAFDSWIPGGVIEQFEWRLTDGTNVQQVIEDEHQFIARPAGPAPLAVWSQWCLEVKGTQDGSVVTGSNCDLVGPQLLLAIDDAGSGSSLPIPVRDGTGRLVAHVDLAAPPPDESGRRPAVWPANVLIHFAGTDPDATPVLVREALATVEIEGEVLAISVLQPGTAADDPPDLPGVAIIYAEDFEQSWTRVFDTDGYGGALLLNPQKGMLWRSSAEASGQDLSAALSTHAAALPIPPSGGLQRVVGVGELAPDFLFEYGPGTTMALRTLRKRPVSITFFKSWSEPCRAELTRMQARHQELAAAGWVILAVCDGEYAETAARLVTELQLGFRVVADPERNIARKYGVQAWPSTVTVDETGVVRQVRTGLVPDDVARSY